MHGLSKQWRLSGKCPTEEGKQQLLAWAVPQGQMAARQAYGDVGLELTVSLIGLEELAVEQQGAFAKGLCEGAAPRQAQLLAFTVAWPSAGGECVPERPET